VIDAARAAGVSHVVKVSYGEPGRRQAGDGRALGDRAVPEGLRALLDHAAASGFMQNFVTGAGAFSDDGDLLGAYRTVGYAYIDCADIAACAAVCLGEGCWRSARTLLLSGPEALSHDEIAAKLSRHWNRSIRYVDLPPRSSRPGSPSGACLSLREDVARCSPR